MEYMPSLEPKVSNLNFNNLNKQILIGAFWKNAFKIIQMFEVKQHLKEMGFETAPIFQILYSTYFHRSYVKILIVMWVSSPLRLSS